MARWRTNSRHAGAVGRFPDERRPVHLSIGAIGEVGSVHLVGNLANDLDEIKNASLCVYVGLRKRFGGGMNETASQYHC